MRNYAHDAQNPPEALALGRVLVKLVGMRFSGRMVRAQLVRAFATLMTLSDIGREIATTRHLQDGEEFELPTSGRVAFSEKLLTARREARTWERSLN